MAVRLGQNENYMIFCVLIHLLARPLIYSLDDDSPNRSTALLSPCEAVSSNYLLSSRELIGKKSGPAGKKEWAERKENRFQERQVEHALDK